MVSSVTALEEAALKNGLSLKKVSSHNDEENQTSLKNGAITDESSQNSVTSDKTQNGTNGDHKKVEVEEDDEDYDVQEFSEPEELIIDEDEPEEPEEDEPEVKKESKESLKSDEDEEDDDEKMDTSDPVASTSVSGGDDDRSEKPHEENDENVPNVPIVKDVRRLDKGLPTFLKRRVKIGRWTPCDMPKGSGEFKMRDSEALVDAPSMTFPLLIKEKDQFARRMKHGKMLPPKPRKTTVPPQSQFKVGQTSVVDFFSSSAGEFLMQIGLDRVEEAYNKDQIKQKEREMRRHGKTAEILESAKRHAEAFQACKAKNAAFHHKMKKCQTCDFKTESQLVLEGHLLTPHFTQRRELQCSFCPFITRDAKAIIFHMEAHHNKVPVMEPPPQFYECPFCPFETNLKNKAGSHVNRCQRYFNNSVNQSPGNEFQSPGMTAKPITNDDIKMYEKFFIALTQAKTQAAAAQAAAQVSTAQQRQQLLMAAAQNRGNQHRGGSNALYQQLQSMAAATVANRAAQAAVGRGSSRNNHTATAQASLLQAQAAFAGAASLLNGNNGMSVTALGAQNRAAAGLNLPRIPPQQDAASVSMTASAVSASGANGGSAAAQDGRASKDLYVDEYDYKYKFKQFCVDGSTRWICTNRKCKAAFVIPKNENKPRFPVAPETHNHKAYKVAETLDAGSHAAAQLAAAGINMQALAHLTNGGSNAHPLFTALTAAARGGGPQSAQAQALLAALGGKDAATKLAQAAAAAANAATGSTGSSSSKPTPGADLSDGILPDKAESMPGVATRLSAPGTGRAPVILESSGQGGAGAQGAAGAFVICEICDGYIKDLEELRSHMQWIHKVKIHPKMLASRPPLSCQKCQWRFFTDQGLERHLLGAHGLVTSNMQEQANNGQDGGRCTVCGRIYASKLVAHMSQVHRVVLKPAHLSYKCTVCTATFNLYRLFESHVYSVHSGAMKRGSSSSDQNATKRKKEDRKDEPTGASAAVKRDEPSYPKTCSLCSDAKIDDWLQHLADKHMPKNEKVGVCQIEKCSSCLSNFDGMVVMNSDLGESSSSSEDDDDD